MISLEFVLIDWIKELKAKHVPGAFLKELNAEHVPWAILEQFNIESILEQ